MAQLTSVDAIKARLRIPASVTTQDAIIDAYRAAIEETILGVTGFSFDGGTRTEDFPDVQLGVSRLMSFRPVAPFPNTDALTRITAQGRSLASDTFNNLIAEIRDSLEGRVMVLASELTPVFPPVGGQAPWFRWRQMIWPVVRFIYKQVPLADPGDPYQVAPDFFPCPKALITAATEWTAFIMAQPSAGAVQSVSIERVSETYRAAWRSRPPIVSALLAKWIREQLVHQF